MNNWLRVTIKTKKYKTGKRKWNWPVFSVVSNVFLKSNCTIWLFVLLLLFFFFKLISCSSYRVHPWHKSTRWDKTCIPLLYLVIRIDGLCNLKIKILVCTSFVRLCSRNCESNRKFGTADWKLSPIRTCTEYGGHPRRTCGTTCTRILDRRKIQAHDPCSRN